MGQFSDRLRAGGVVIGGWLNSVSPVMAEVMAQAGYDFVVVDAEHSAVDMLQALQLFQAIRSGDPGCCPVVRLPGQEVSQAARFLDAGAGGVIAPLVNSAAQAREIIATLRYPPVGRRGLGFARSNRYGADVAEAIRTANEDIPICIQIEHADGVRCIGEILAVPGIDAVMIGPYDLSASLGLPGRFDHPEYLAAVETVLDACVRHGVAPGIHVVEPDPREAIARIEAGFRLIGYSLDIVIVSRESKRGLSTIRSAGLPG